MDFNEEQVIKESQEGNIESFGLLVENYKNKIYGISLALSRNNIEAEEISQQVFIKLWRNIDKYSYKSSFSTWLYRLAHNTFCDYLRKNKRHSDKIVPMDKLYGLKKADNSYANIQEKEIKTVVYEALGGIPEEFRLIVIYYDLEGRGYREIAEITQTPIGTVKSRLFRGRKLLKERLGNIFETLNV